MSWTRLRTLPSVLATLVAVAFLVTACSASGGSGASPDEPAGGTAAGSEPGSADSAEVRGFRAVALVARVVRVAEISMRVERGTLDATIDRANTIAGSYGGFVESTSVHGTDERYGRAVVRVPVDLFDEALHDLESLGEVRSSSVSGRDVTAQFVDIDARLRNLRTQVTVLRSLLAETTTVDDSLRVQSALSEVQLEVERLTGERNVLENRTELSTIALNLSEPGSRPDIAASSADRPRLQAAFQAAITTFLAVVYGVIVALGVLVPLAIGGAVVWVVLWVIRVRQRARIAA